MEFLKLHDIPIKTLTKYFLSNDKISHNFRYKPYFSPKTVTQYYQYVYKMNNTYYSVDTVDIPNVFMSDEVFSKLFNIDINDLDSFEISVPNYTSDALRILSKDDYEFNEAISQNQFVLFNTPANEGIVIDQKQIYYIPFKNIISAYMNYQSLYPYFGIIENKPFYALDKTSITFNSNNIDIYTNNIYNDNNKYDIIISKSLINDIIDNTIDNNKVIYFYDENTNIDTEYGLEYVKIYKIQSNNLLKECGKIYKLNLFNTILYDINGYKYRDTYIDSDVYLSTPYGATTPIMRYHNYMRKIKEFSYNNASTKFIDDGIRFNERNRMYLTKFNNYLDIASANDYSVKEGTSIGSSNVQITDELARYIKTRKVKVPTVNSENYIEQNSTIPYELPEDSNDKSSASQLDIYKTNVEYYNDQNKYLSDNYYSTVKTYYNTKDTYVLRPKIYNGKMSFKDYGIPVSTISDLLNLPYYNYILTTDETPNSNKTYYVLDGSTFSVATITNNTFEPNTQYYEANEKVRYVKILNKKSYNSLKNMSHYTKFIAFCISESDNIVTVPNINYNNLSDFECLKQKYTLVYKYDVVRSKPVNSTMFNITGDDFILKLEPLNIYLAEQEITNYVYNTTDGGDPKSYICNNAITYGSLIIPNNLININIPTLYNISEYFIEPFVGKVAGTENNDVNSGNSTLENKDRELINIMNTSLIENQLSNTLTVNDTVNKHFMFKYTESLFENLIYTVNIQSKYNAGDLCMDKYSHSHYIGFIPYNRLEVSFIANNKYEKIDPADNNYYETKPILLSDADREMIKNQVLSKNVLDRIINYKKYPLNAQEIHDIIQKQTLDKIYTNLSDVNKIINVNTKEEDKKYIERFFDCHNILDKSYNLVTEYLSTISDANHEEQEYVFGTGNNITIDTTDNETINLLETSVLNENFYKQKLPLYIEVLSKDTNRLLYTNNHNYNIKHVFNNDSTDKNTFIMLLRTQLGEGD